MAVTGSQSSASPATLIALVVVLAGLDLVGALLAKEWTSGRSPWMFAGGALVFLLLFSVYAIGLRFAEMSTVTFGWIVGLQVAVLFLERHPIADRSQVVADVETSRGLHPREHHFTMGCWGGFGTE